MPSGSYTDGHTNARAWVSNWITDGLGSISGIQNTPDRAFPQPLDEGDTSAASSGVSGAPAHSTSCTDGSSAAAARSSTGSPFCRVTRPTKIT